MNRRDAAVLLLQSTAHKLSQTTQLKQLRLKPASPTARHLSIQPTQMHPDIEQHETQRDQHKAVGGIGRGRPAPHLTRTAVTALDAKPFPIPAACLARREVEFDQRESLRCLARCEQAIEYRATSNMASSFRQCFSLSSFEWAARYCQIMSYTRVSLQYNMV